MSVERVSGEEASPWLGEHLHRYNECLKYIQKNDVILDLACGSGYGTKMLSTPYTNTVYGGDIDNDTIEACRVHWKENENLRFERMDATSLRFDNSFFNVIVSLETIEHLTAYSDMLSEFARVLADDGTLLLSTPNRPVSSPTGVIVNPFHTQEFNYRELKDLLLPFFKEVTVYGQKYARYYKKNKGARFLTEKILLLRGVRKIRYKIRNTIFRSIFKTELYPTPEDYIYLTDEQEISSGAHVLFVVCKK